MITNLGDFKADSTVYFMYNTTDQGGSSVAPTADGTIRVYKNASTTERSSQAGITLDNNFDTADLGDGIQHVSIDLSNNTDAGFYAAGNDYFIVLDTATIDGETVSAVLAMFSIENRVQTVPGKAAVPAVLSGTPSTTSLASSADLAGNFADDVFNGRRAYVLTGTYAGESADITDYVDSTGTLTVDTLPGGAPAAGDQIVIL